MKKREPGIDSLRAVAALSVFLLHGWMYSFGLETRRPRVSFSEALTYELRLGLIFFFVLSGYLLYRDFIRAALLQEGRVPLGEYLSKRLFRIIPAYYAVIVGSLLLLWNAGTTPGVKLVPTDELWRFFLFMQNYSMETLMRLNPVTWTLCVEMLFYLILPIFGYIAYTFGSKRPWAHVLLIVLLGASGVIWNMMAYYGEFSMIGDKALPAYFPYFACGMLVALGMEWKDFRKGQILRLTRLGTTVLLAVGVSGVLGNALWHASVIDLYHNFWIHLFQDLPAGLGFAALTASVVMGQGFSIQWAKMTWLTKLGVVSYGFYLWHIPLTLFGRSLHIFPDGVWATFLYTFPLTLLISVVSWKCIEAPAMKLILRKKGTTSSAASLETRYTFSGSYH
jgi:peptidoglycan/LPS O-acetylase OafA/YrhL